MNRRLAVEGGVPPPGTRRSLNLRLFRRAGCRAEARRYDGSRSCHESPE